MKLITAIVNKEDARAVNKRLVEAGFSATQLATTGGFLLSANVTFLIGTEDGRVDECIGLIASRSRQRTEMVPGNTGFDFGASTPPIEVTVGGATVFVTDVERFEKL